MKDKFIEIRLSEIFECDNIDSKNITLNDIACAKPDLDGVRILNHLSYSDLMEEKHYENALKQTGVDFKTFKEKEIIDILIEIDFESYKSISTEDDYYYDVFLERVFGVRQDGFYNLKSGFIGNGKEFVYLGRSGNLKEKGNAYKMINGKFFKATEEFTDDVIYSFDRVVFYVDFRNVERKGFNPKESKKQKVDNFLNNISANLISDMHFYLEEYADQDLNYYCEVLDSTIADYLDEADWTFILKKLREKNTHKEEKLAA